MRSQITLEMNEHATSRQRKVESKLNVQPIMTQFSLSARFTAKLFGSPVNQFDQVLDSGVPSTHAKCDSPMLFSILLKPMKKEYGGSNKRYILNMLIYL